METINEIENTSSQLFRIIEDDLTLDSDTIIFDWIEDTFDGIFTRVSDYTRLANRINKFGISEFLTWISKRSNKCFADAGHCQVIRESKLDTKATILFRKPVNVLFSKINNEPITGKVNRIEGEFSFEWWWLKNGRQKEIASAFEVYFKCENYFLDPPSNKPILK